MPILKVSRLAEDDVYTDTARINEKHRVDKGRKIPEGRVCKVSIAGKSKLLSLRGNVRSSDPTICLDDISRDALRVILDQEIAVDFHPVWWFGQFLWAWRASDPAYRIAARVGLLSVSLGIVGLVLGIVGIFIALRN